MGTARQASFLASNPPGSRVGSKTRVVRVQSWTAKRVESRLKTRSPEKMGLTL